MQTPGTGHRHVSRMAANSDIGRTATPPMKTSAKAASSNATSTKTPVQHIIRRSPLVTSVATKDNLNAHGWAISDIHTGDEFKCQLLSHIFKKGLEESVCSDLAIKIPTFKNKTYNLHRIILIQSSFFNNLLQPPWFEAGSREINMQFDDPNISQSAFESVLAHLYGKDLLHISHSHLGDSFAMSLLATAHYLDVPVLVKAALVHITNHVCLRTARKFFEFATGPHWYGDASLQIRNAVLVMLARDGYDMVIRKKSPLAMHVWTHLPLEWIKKLVSNDAFFVEREIQRYKFLRKLLKLKRQAQERGDIDDENIDDAFRDIFGRAIILSHTSFKELKWLKTDIDPVTNKPYMPESVVHKALWVKTDLENCIKEKADTSELALGLSTIDATNPGVIGGIYRMPSHDYTRLGDAMGFLLDNNASENIVGKNSLLNQDNEDTEEDCDSDNDYKGITLEDGDNDNDDDHYDDDQYDDEDAVIEAFGTTPPFRFGVEFDNIDAMLQDHRYYSNDFFYAGSLWNIYIQRIKSKRRTQLGIYLHRQSIDQRRNPKEDENPEHHWPKKRRPAPIDYEDRRQETNAWFRIICHPSPMINCGHSVSESTTDSDDSRVFNHIGCNHYSQEPSVFESAPDKFSISQSWGWRSGSLYPFSSQPIVTSKPSTRIQRDTLNGMLDLLNDMNIDAEESLEDTTDGDSPFGSEAEEAPKNEATDKDEFAVRSDGDIFGGVIDIGRDKNDHGTVRICVIMSVI